MTSPLLHLATPAEWRAHQAAGVIAPSVAEFVHLSTPDQVALPATRLFAGRHDLLLLVLDPARIGVEVRLEPGVPSDPASMRFPHAYGPIPTSAVVAVVPYPPGPDGTFAVPLLPLNGNCLGEARVPGLATRSDGPVPSLLMVLLCPAPHRS